jgi:hypothetical protein
MAVSRDGVTRPVAPSHQIINSFAARRIACHRDASNLWPESSDVNTSVRIGKSVNKFFADHFPESTLRRRSLEIPACILNTCESKSKLYMDRDRYELSRLPSSRGILRTQGAPSLPSEPKLPSGKTSLAASRQLAPSSKPGSTLLPVEPVRWPAPVICFYKRWSPVRV